MEIKNTAPFVITSYSIHYTKLYDSFLSDRFLTGENAWNVMRQISVNVIISVGMTLVILTGGIDLSVGSILALAGAVTAGMLKFGAEFTDMNVYLGFTLLGAS